MTRKLLSLLVVFCMGSLVSTAQACDGCDKGKGTKTAAKAPCDPSKCKEPCDPAKCPHAKAKLTAAVGDDGRSESGTAGVSPCRGSAKLTSGKTKAGGDKPCRHAAKGGWTMSKKADAILASMPSMKYKVGKEITGCSKSASKMADANGGKIQYLIGDEVFSDEGKATSELSKALEDKIASLASIQYSVGGDSFHCPLKAKDLAKKTDAKIAYRVAGFDFADREKAEEVLEVATKALKQVKMTYKVGDKSFCCDKLAGAKAKETGTKIVYVVGEEETCCSQAAQLKLTETKIRTIVETVAGLLTS